MKKRFLIKRKSQIKRKPGIIMALLLFVMLVPAAVFADETSSLKIPVSLYLTGSIGEGGEKTYRFQILPKEDAPAPVNEEAVIEEFEKTTAQDGTEIWQGKGYFVFELAAFEKPDDYSYVITQTTEADEKIKTLDESEYTVTVRILNGENGRICAVWAEKNSEARNDREGAKCDIEYYNERIPTPKPSGVQEIFLTPKPSTSPKDQETPAADDPSSGHTAETPPSSGTESRMQQAPKTGDQSQAAFYFSVLLVSVAVVMIVIKRRMRK